MDKCWLLTTYDNPYNPFTQYKEWYAYDISAGHNTCSLLGRLSVEHGVYDGSDLFMTMSSIVRLDPFERYVLVTRESFDLLMA